MANLNQLRNRVNSWLTAKWPIIVAKQQQFYNRHGRYWQGLRTHNQTPQHTNSQDGDSVPDKLDDKPTDQVDKPAWRNIFPDWLSEQFPASLQIDVYSGPQGQGWVASIEIEFQGVRYRRSQNVGPENYRTQDWHRIDGIP